jgi:GATA zinc finger.
LFDIFHSRDNVQSSQKSKPSSHDKTSKENLCLGSSLDKSDDPLHRQRSLKRSNRQRDIRYYFRRNAKVKVISYTNQTLPMDASPIRPENCIEVDGVDNMDVESPIQVELMKEDLSDMEIENPIAKIVLNQLSNCDNKIQTTKSYKISSSSTKRRPSPSRKTSQNQSTRTRPITRSLHLNVQTKKTQQKLSESMERERSPLNSPHRSSNPMKSDKPIKFASALPSLSSRKILKPISCRFRRYHSMIEISRGASSTPTFRNLTDIERNALTEPRNKRKINPRELFDELDKDETVSTSKKSRKAADLSTVSLPPPVRRLPLFKPSTKLRCYGDVDLGVHPLPSTKECQSCCTSQTVIWRDTDDGVPLCNTCGIRWRKYRYRCTQCWYVPMQEEIVQPNCGSCGKLQAFRRFKTLRRHLTNKY